MFYLTLTYQWTRKKTELNDEINNALYDESQGIIDIAIKINLVAQMEAILSGEEKVTSSLIKKTAKEHFGVLRPVMEAIKSGNEKMLKKYGDVKKPDIFGIVGDLEERLYSEDYINYKENKTKEQQKEVESVLTQRLTESFKDSKVIQESVKEVLVNFNVENFNIDELYNRAFNIVEEKVLKKKKGEKKQISYQEGDLRKVKEEATNNGQSVYDYLLNEKILIDPYHLGWRYQ